MRRRGYLADVAKNEALAAAMADLALSQTELARRLNAENEALTGREGRLTDRDVRRYLDGGTQWPHARQRLCLEKVLGRSATELGFSRGETGQARPGPTLPPAVLHQPALRHSLDSV